MHRPIQLTSARDLKLKLIMAPRVIIAKYLALQVSHTAAIVVKGWLVKD